MMIPRRRREFLLLRLERGATGLSGEWSSSGVITGSQQLRETLEKKGG